MPYWSLFYHLVWSTKYRLPIIEPAWESDLYGYLRGKSAALECRLHAIGGMPDHIHVVISIPPKIEVARLTGLLKGASSHRVNEKYAHGSFAWQTEYGAFTFSERELPHVRAYVINQKKHHADNTIDPALETSPGGA
jgi:putative transposase